MPASHGKSRNSRRLALDVPVRTSTRRGKTKGRKSTTDIAGVETYVMLDTVAKEIATELNVLGGPIQAEMLKPLIAEGCRLRKRPENIRISENEAEASGEMRMRSSRSPLSVSEEKLFDDHGIELEDISTYVIGERYARDDRMMAQVVRALRAAGLPKDILQREEERVLVTDRGLDQIFRKPVKVVEKLLPLAVTLAIKPGKNSVDLDDAWRRTQEVVMGATPGESEDDVDDAKFREVLMKKVRAGQRAKGRRTSRTRTPPKARRH